MFNEPSVHAGRNRNLWLVQGIGRHLRRIVPAGIFEIKKDPHTVGAFDRIVKPVIRGAERAHPGPGCLCAQERLPLARPDRFEAFLQKPPEC